MEEKDRKKISKTGRKPKNDPAVNRYSINLNAEDNAKFLALFDQSGMKVIAHFITACIFPCSLISITTFTLRFSLCQYNHNYTRLVFTIRIIWTFTQWK